MEEIKMENVLNDCRVKGKGLSEALNRVNAHSSDILVFSVQWKDLNEYLESVQAKVEKRFRELECKEVELKGQSFALEERAKVVEDAYAKLADLEVKSEAKKKELNFLTKQVEISLGESNAEEAKLSRLRTLVEECEAEQVLKASELSEMVESCREETHVELGLKGEELAKMETELEKCRDDVSAEMEVLSRTQTHRRQLDEEVERKTKDLTLVQNKLAECEQLIETSSSELFKTQDELECKREQLGQIEADLERHRVKVSAEMESLRGAQTHMRQLVEEVERKTKDLTLVQTKLVECEKLFKTSSSELIKTQCELECKQEQLGEMEVEFQRHHVKVNAEKELWQRTQTHSRELDEEIERKGKDLAMVLDKIAERGAQLESVEGQLDSQQKLLETQVSELITKEKELQALSLDIDLREETVRSLNNEMEETCQQMESKAKELENVERLIEERSAHCESLKLLTEEHSEELVSKVKQQDEMTDTIRKLSLEIVFKETTLERAEGFIQKLSVKQVSAEKKLHSTEKKLDLTRRHLERCLGKHESKEKELCTVKDRYRECLGDLDTKEKELKSVESILTERNKQVEEGVKRMQRLNSSNEELMGQLKLKQEEVCSINERIVECSGELTAKRKQRDQVQSSLTDLLAELYSVKKKIQDSLKDLQSKEVELKDKSFALEERAKKVEEAEAKLVDLERKSDAFRMEAEAKKKEVNVIKNQVEISLAESNAEEVRLSELRTLVDEKAERKLKDLTLVQDKIEGCEKMFETRSSELVSKEKELKMLSQKINSREQMVMSLNNDMKEACQRMENIQKLIEERSAQCESLKLLIEEHNEKLALAEIAPPVSALTPVKDVLSLDVKPEAPINNSAASLSHLPNEDAILTDIEGSTSLSPNEVSTELPMFKNPGRFVLTSVEKAFADASERGEWSLEEPIVKTLVPLLEELARAVRSTDPGLQHDATRVALRWARMMGSSVEKSQLEAWAFLHFIVAFGLVKWNKQDHTLQLASLVTHFKHAPKLFESLGLTHAIPNFVTQLLDKGISIPAIRFMLYFNVKNKFSPLEILKKQIINLRRSAKEKRTYGSQDEANRDAATVRDIMELIEDFQLEIDIPVALIFKFMVPRDIQDENQLVASSSVPVQSTHMQTDIQSSTIATHGSNPSLPTSFGTEPYQAGGSTALSQDQLHSHNAGSKRPRVVGPEGSRPVIRPCFNPPAGIGKF